MPKKEKRLCPVCMNTEGHRVELKKKRVRVKNKPRRTYEYCPVCGWETLYSITKVSAK